MCPFTVRVPQRWSLADFLGSMITGAVASPLGARRTVGVQLGTRICLRPSTPTPFNPLFRQGAAVPLLRLRVARCGSNGMFTVSPSDSPKGLSLGPDLPRDDWRCPGNLGLAARGYPTPFIVTYTYICLSRRSRGARAPPSTRTGMLPYRYNNVSHGFGIRFDTRLLSMPSSSTSELLRTL